MNSEPYPDAEAAILIAAAAQTSTKNVKRAALFRSLLKFVDQTMIFFWGVYFTQIGLTGVEQGILFAIFPLIGIASVIPAGLLNDRVYPKTLITLGYLLFGTEFILLTQTTNFWMIVLLFIVGSLGLNLTDLSLESLFYKTGDKKQTKQVGRYVGTYLAGAGLGVFFGGLLLERIEFTQVFLIAGALAFIASLLSILVLPKTETFHFKIAHYLKDLRKPTVFVFLAMIFLWAIHMSSEVTSYGLYLRENLGLTYQQMGLFMGIAIFLMIIWANLASHLISRGTRLRKILYTGLFCSGVGHMVLTIPIIEISFMGRLIHEFGDSFMFVFMAESIRQLFPTKRSGGNAGMVRFTQISAVTIGALIFAPLGKEYGNEYPLIIASSFSLLGLPIAFYLRDFIRT